MQRIPSDNPNEYGYMTQGTCSQAVKFTLDDEGKVHDVGFYGGCNGNLKGIGSLVEDMPAEWVIERCSGVQCGMKPTSCPDQLACALKEAIADQQA